MNVSFWADDAERTMRELEGKGVELVMKPQKADWGTAAAFKDLDGNTLVSVRGKSEEGGLRECELFWPLLQVT